MVTLSQILEEELLILHQYRTMVDDTNIVSKADPRGRITYVNAKFIAISGYSEEELIGKPHSILRDPDMPSETFKDLWKTIQAKKIWHGVVSNLRKDGTKYTVNASIFPIFNSVGKITEYISIRHDITQLLELTKTLEEINAYTQKQELMAKEKLEAGIINDLAEDEYALIHLASDTLSGDFYSIYKMNNGSLFFYIIDGQGHGLSPALTVFAVSSMLNQFIPSMNTMQELLEKLHPIAKTFLADLEQLSYTMIMLSPDRKSITYASGGMYPILIKTEDEILKIKANNSPFMNFSEIPVCTTVDIKEWQKILIYSDGIIEGENDLPEIYMPQNLINETADLQKLMNEIKKFEFEDDVTMLCLNRQK